MKPTRGERALVRSECQRVEDLIDRQETFVAGGVAKDGVIPALHRDGSERFAADFQWFARAEAEEDPLVSRAREAGRDRVRKRAAIDGSAPVHGRRECHMRATICPFAAPG